MAVATDGTLLLLNGPSLVTLDPGDGHVIGTLDVPGVDPTLPLNFTVGGDGSVYAFSFGKPQLVAVDRAHSQVRWQATTPCGLVSGPLVGADGTVFVGCIDQNVALDPCDGHVVWSTPNAYPNYGEVGAIAPDGALIGKSSSPGIADAVVAFAPADGHALWSAAPPPGPQGRFNLPVIGTDGSIYVSAQNSAGVMGKKPS